MAVITLTSVTGAPGVTTTALALAMAWPRPCLVVEADLVGGSSILAGHHRGQVHHTKGLIDLALAHRRGELADGLHRASIPLGLSPTARFVPGLTTPAQAATMRHLWEPIAVVLKALDRTGTDVIVDAGRLGAIDGPTPLIREADQALLVTRTDLPAIPALRSRARILKDEMGQRGADPDVVSLVLVGEGQPYSGREISRFTGTPVAAALPWDPVNAAVLSHGRRQGSDVPIWKRILTLGLIRPASYDRSPLARAARTTVTGLQTTIRDRRELLAPEPEERRDPAVPQPPRPAPRPQQPTTTQRHDPLQGGATRG